MRLLERLRGATHRVARDSGSAVAGSADGQPLPIPRYDQLNRKQLIPQLAHLSQLELAAIEAHERTHRDRPAVLNRLRWLRGSEPLPGYDALDSSEIATVLADADAATVKAVRSYERHHRDRGDVLAEAARVLPAARASPQQNRARKDKAALVRAGMELNPRATLADLNGPPAIKTKARHSSLDRMDAARAQRNEREQLRDEARYRRERLDLYRARLYSGRAASHGKLRELQRASDGAAARLHRAETAGPPTQPPT